MPEAGRTWYARAFGSAIVRQTLLILAVFLVVDVASLGVAYLKLRADLETELEEVLRGDIASFDVAATPRALAAIVSARARVSAPEDKVIVLLQADGGQVGNARTRMEDGDLHLLPLEGDVPLAPEGYLRDTATLDGGVLLVGVSLRPLRELTDTFLVLLLLSLVPTALISIFTATTLSRQSARRVSRIEETLNRISSGDLGARVDGSGGADDLDRIADGVNRMAERQQGATEALRQVTTDIAHDLKTPLQRLSVLLDELDQQLEGQAGVSQIIDDARAEAGRAVGIFDAMMRIARIEGGHVPLGTAEVDLRELAQRIVELHQPSLEDTGRTVSLSVPPLPVLVRGDADLLGQAISNLIENADRHTPPGTAIEVVVDPTATDVAVTVADRGAGIAEADRERVRQRFVRLERSRSTLGHGLGLALVTAIAKLHDGRLILDDNKPGLRATLVVPCIPPSAVR